MIPISPLSHSADCPQKRAVAYAAWITRSRLDRPGLPGSSPTDRLLQPGWDWFSSWNVTGSVLASKRAVLSGALFTWLVAPVQLAVSSCWDWVWIPRVPPASQCACPLIAHITLGTVVSGGAFLKKALLRCWWECKSVQLLWRTVWRCL